MGFATGRAAMGRLGAAKAEGVGAKTEGAGAKTGVAGAKAEGAEVPKVKGVGVATLTSSRLYCCNSLR